MTDHDHDRLHEVREPHEARDEAQAAEFPREPQNRPDELLEPADLEYGGQPQFDSDRSDPVAYSTEAGRTEADPDVLRTDDAVLTRDPDAGLSAETGAVNDQTLVEEPARVEDRTPISGPALVESPDKLMIRWQEVQIGFVDDPREALRTADALVQQVMEQVAEQFATERNSMEAQWSRGEDVSTEDLRLVLQRYRTFFNRLLQV